MSRIGLIAGNGRFPFLVLKGARSLGHDVTIVAVKEEAFLELETEARSAGAELHWVSLGQLSKCERPRCIRCSQLLVRLRRASESWRSSPCTPQFRPAPTVTDTT